MKSILLGDAPVLRQVYSPAVRERLTATAGLEGEFTAAALKETALPGVEAVFSTWSMPALSEEEIARSLPDLKAVFYAAGSVQYFARPFLKRGVRVFSAWGANGVPVAEYTLAQILLANKGFFHQLAPYSRGERKVGLPFPGNYGCKVGILGAGMIGSLVIELLRRHHLSVMVFDPFLPPEKAAAMGVELADLPTVFAECQVVSCHLANNPQTVGMLNYELFSRMRPGAVFLNTGRGAQVVEADLCRLLEERPDVMAVLDVTDPEPPLAESPFFTLPNVWLTPHIAGSIGQEVERMAEYMAEECDRFSAGTPCLYEVTETMLATMA